MVRSTLCFHFPYKWCELVFFQEKNWCFSKRTVFPRISFPRGEVAKASIWPCNDWWSPLTLKSLAQSGTIHVGNVWVISTILIWYFELGRFDSHMSWLRPCYGSGIFLWSQDSENTAIPFVLCEVGVKFHHPARPLLCESRLRRGELSLPPHVNTR